MRIVESFVVIAMTKYNSNKLGSLSVKNTSGKGYAIFVAFKKENSVKTKGNHWHHIVE